jgi:hypothetical protein
VWTKKLLLQICSIISKEDKKVYVGKHQSSRNLYVVQATALQQVQIRAMYDFYLPLLNKQLKDLRKAVFVAFVSKNELYVKDDGSSREDKAPDLDFLRKVYGAMDGIEKVPFHKQLKP